MALCNFGWLPKYVKDTCISEITVNRAILIQLNLYVFDYTFRSDDGQL